MEDRRAADFRTRTFSAAASRAARRRCGRGRVRLQDAERDLEPLEVLLEAAVPLADLHRLGETFLGVGGKPHLLLFRKLEHGLES
jgi:hypothetical protein